MNALFKVRYPCELGPTGLPHDQRSGALRVEPTGEARSVSRQPILPRATSLSLSSLFVIRRPAGRRQPAGPQLRGDGPQRDWLLVAAFVVAGVAPLANALGAVIRGWVPYGDEAIIATRARDFGTTLTPLLGMPSTFAAVSSHNPTQPGPLQFWALGPFCRLLGPAAGVLVGTAVINGLSIVGVGVVAYRVCGRRAALVGLGIALTLILLVNGPTFSFEPVNSIAPVLPLMFTLTLAWAVASGSLRSLPLLVLSGSFTVQADLEFVGVVLIVTVWAVGALALQRRHRPTERRGTTSAVPAGAGRGQSWLRSRDVPKPVVATVVVGGLCWAGPLTEAVRNGGGNLWEIWLTFISPGRSLALAGAGRGLGGVLDLPPLFVRNSSIAVQWERGLDPTALITVLALGYLWWRARTSGLPSAPRLVSAAAVTAIAVAANAYRLPVEPFTANHLMFVRGAGGFVWFAVLAGALEVTAVVKIRWWPIPAVAAGIAALAIDLPDRSPSRAIATGMTWIVAAVVIVGLISLLSSAGIHQRRGVAAPLARPVADAWMLRSLGALVVVLLAVGVAVPPKLSTSYRSWIYDAIPRLDRQVDAGVRTPRGHADAFLVAAAGGDRYLDVAKGLITHLEASGTPTLVGVNLVQTYGSRRSYRAHQDKAAGEILVVPVGAVGLPRRARRIASWRPPHWGSPAFQQLRTNVAAFVRSQGEGRLTLTAEGHNRLPALLAYSVPAPAGDGGTDHTGPYRDDPAQLAALAPAVLTNLYAEPWAVAAPRLTPTLHQQLDELAAAPAIDVWFIPGPLPAAAGS